MTVAGNTIKLTNIPSEVWAGRTIKHAAVGGRFRQQGAGDSSGQLSANPTVPGPQPALRETSERRRRLGRCTPQTVPNFTAVLYFFGREIQGQNVPSADRRVVGVRASNLDTYGTRGKVEADLDIYNKLKADARRHGDAGFRL
jgi:hypothetical protein